MSRVSTHVLDTTRGRPAAGIIVKLFHAGRLIGSSVTDADGRCPNLLPGGFPLHPGAYRLLFEVATYFPDGFYPEVSVSFQVNEDTRHYHVPLLISAFGYTTYRGS